MKAYKYLHVLLIVILTTWAPNALSLSQEAQIDLYVSKMRSAFIDGRYRDGLNAINKLKGLNIDLGPEILYYEGKALYETGKVSQSLQVIERYINQLGRDGDNYQEALSLYSAIESKIAKIKAKEKKKRQAYLDFEKISFTATTVLKELCNTTYLYEKDGAERTVWEDLKGKWPTKEYGTYDFLCHGNGTFDLVHIKNHRSSIPEAKSYAPRNTFSYIKMKTEKVSVFDFSFYVDSSKRTVWETSNKYYSQASSFDTKKSIDGRTTYRHVNSTGSWNYPRKLKRLSESLEFTKWKLLQNTTTRIVDLMGMLNKEKEQFVRKYGKDTFDNYAYKNDIQYPVTTNFRKKMVEGLYSSVGSNIPYYDIVRTKK